MWLYILYIHISAYAHAHIQAHSLMRAPTLSCARTHARTRMHIHTTYTGARAQTRIHPGTCGPDYARTHAPAHEHACMRTHTRKHTRTCTHVHAHPRYARACSHMQTCARTMYMHAYARGTVTAAPSFQTCFSCVHMYILYACVYICVCVYVCGHVVCIYMHVCMYLYIYAFIHVCMCMCMHICA